MFPFTAAIKKKKLERARRNTALRVNCPPVCRETKRHRTRMQVNPCWLVYDLRCTDCKETFAYRSMPCAADRPPSAPSALLIYLKYFCLSARVTRSFPLGQRVERICDCVTHYTRWKTHFLRDYKMKEQEGL